MVDSRSQFESLKLTHNKQQVEVNGKGSGRKAKRLMAKKSRGTGSDESLESAGSNNKLEEANNVADKQTGVGIDSSKNNGRDDNDDDEEEQQQQQDEDESNEAIDLESIDERAGKFHCMRGVDVCCDISKFCCNQI